VDGRRGPLAVSSQLPTPLRRSFEGVDDARTAKAVAAFALWARISAGEAAQEAGCTFPHLHGSC